MDEFWGNYIPPFGSWDCDNHLQFTQSFESARKGCFIGYGFGYPQDRHHYVAGDLYENNVVTPAMIVIPRRRRKVPVGKKKFGCDYDYDFVHDGKIAPAPEEYHRNHVHVNVKPKAVDEDLYKISPELLRMPPRRKKSKMWGLFSMCMLPTCVI